MSRPKPARSMCRGMRVWVVGLSHEPSWSSSVAGMTFEDHLISWATVFRKHVDLALHGLRSHLRRLRRRCVVPSLDETTAHGLVCALCMAKEPKLSCRSRTRCAPPSSLLPVSTPRDDQGQLLRRRDANRATCSVLVGSHHLDGLLHRPACRLVASCIRPWGSSCFQRAADPECTEVHHGSCGSPFPGRCTPYEGFPSSRGGRVSPPNRPSMPLPGRLLPTPLSHPLPAVSWSGSLPFWTNFEVLLIEKSPSPTSSGFPNDLARSFHGLSSPLQGLSVYRCPAIASRASSSEPAATLVRAGNFRSTIRR